MITALIVLGALAGYVAFVAAVVRFIGHAGENAEPEPEPAVVVNGCTNPACECRAARARILDRLAASGEVPGLAWGDRDDDAVAVLLDGGGE